MPGKMIKGICHKYFFEPHFDKRTTNNSFVSAHMNNATAVGSTHFEIMTNLDKRLHPITSGKKATSFNGTVELRVLFNVSWLMHSW